MWPHFAAITVRPLAWLMLHIAGKDKRLPDRHHTHGEASAGIWTERCGRGTRGPELDQTVGPEFGFARGSTMFEFRDLFQWDRFITPTIIKTFYWLVIALVTLFGISGIFSGLGMMVISPFGGFLMLLSSIAGVIVGIVFSRIVAEFILIVFRINEHLGAIREQGRMH